jgi:hypothetical protein
MYLQALASQSSNIFEYLANGGAVLLSITAAGRLNAVGVDAGTAVITSPSAGSVPLITINNGGQTADAWQHKSSGGTVLAKLDKNGKLTVTEVVESDTFPWGGYSPTLTGVTSGGTKGNGTFSIQYEQIRSTVRLTGEFTRGSTTSFGVGGVKISLPVPAATLARPHIGHGLGIDISGAYSVLACELEGDTSHFIFVSNDGVVNSNTPWVWDDGDKLRFGLEYEAA